MPKDIGKLLGILASIAAIIGTCIAIIALIPAFGQWIPTLDDTPSTVEVSPTITYAIETSIPSETLPIPSSTDLPTPTLPATPTPEVATQVIFENGEFRNTTSDDFTFRVAKIELNPNGKMRWYLDFWNKSNKDVLYGLDYSNTVLADEFGNQYDIQDASTYPNKTFEKSVAAGVRDDLWIDFDAPINNAQKFRMTLTPANSYWHPHYGLLEIIVTYDTSSTPPAPAPTILSSASSVPFASGDFQTTTSANFDFRVARIDLLSNSRMRWYFEFWNKSDQPVLFGLNYSNITLADENGRPYSVLDASTFPNKSFEKSVPAGVLYSLWMEFDAPADGAMIFKVTLAPSNQYWHPHYDVFNITFK